MERKELGMDDFSTSFKTYEELCDFLYDLSDSASWKIEPIYTMRAETAEAIRQELVDEDLLEDTRKNTGLIIRTPEEYFPLGTTATNTLLSRMKISGTGLRSLSPYGKSIVYNELFAVAKGDARLRIVGGKIVAAHAGASNDYSVIPQEAVFEATNTYLKANYAAEFLGASYDHYCTLARWSIFTEEAYLYYRELMEQMDLPISEDIELLVTVLTSDVGWTGANIRYQIKAGSHRICLGKEIKCDHKNGNDIETFRKNLNLIMSGYQKGITQLGKLGKIQLIHYNDAIYYAMKKAKLGKVMINQVQKNILDPDRVESGSALEAYLDICRVLDFADSKGLKGRPLAELEENVASCALIDWKDCDKARPKD